MSSIKLFLLSSLLLFPAAVFSQTKPEQFQLKIDKTQREISFFERVTSGGFSMKREETTSAEPTTTGNTSKTDAQKRAVIFFVDDLHLAPDSLLRTRRALLEYINGNVGENRCS